MESNTELAGAIQELCSWLTLAYGASVRERLEAVLDTDEKVPAYEAADGQASTRVIAGRVGVDQKTISRWWSE